MDFKLQTASLSELDSVSADALVVVIGPQGIEKNSVHPSLAALVNQAIAGGDFEHKAGRTLLWPSPAGIKAKRVVLASAGTCCAKGFKAAVLAALASLKNIGAKHLSVALVGGELSEQHVRALVSAVDEASYVYRATKPSAPAAPVWNKVSVLVDNARSKALIEALRVGQAIQKGVALARECANLPGNVATPSYLADVAKKLGKQHQFKVEVLERKDVEKLGMGSFLAVAQASHEPLKFIVAQYQGAAKSVKPVVLVGKGITFDTGGVSLKPAAEMDEMKFDMGGAASVLGTLASVAELAPKLNLVVIVPSCENMPGGGAVKPGDVVTSMSGQTIEILNTDAEGRLILCDALTYAERFKPEVVVDVATLTGACVIALGHHRTGLFSSDDQVAEQLLKSGDSALDPAWRMPLDDDYADALKSSFADMGNVGGRAGGSITAALFLKKFTAKFPWAHLDIAGTAWKSGANKGATGRPVGLLTQFVLSHAK